MTNRYADDLRNSRSVAVTGFPLVVEMRYCIARSDVEISNNIELTLSSEATEETLSFRFHRVTDLRLDNRNRGLLRIVGLSIANMRQDGWENVKWQVTDFENDVISFYCSEIDIP